MHWAASLVGDGGSDEQHSGLSRRRRLPPAPPRPDVANYMATAALERFSLAERHVVALEAAAEEHAANDVGDGLNSEASAGLDWREPVRAVSPRSYAASLVASADTFAAAARARVGVEAGRIGNEVSRRMWPRTEGCALEVCQRLVELGDGAYARASLFEACEAYRRAAAITRQTPRDSVPVELATVAFARLAYCHAELGHAERATRSITRALGLVLRVPRRCRLRPYVWAVAALVASRCNDRGRAQSCLDAALSAALPETWEEESAEDEADTEGWRGDVGGGGGAEAESRSESKTKHVYSAKKNRPSPPRCFCPPRTRP